MILIFPFIEEIHFWLNWIWPLIYWGLLLDFGRNLIKILVLGKWKKSFFLLNLHFYIQGTSNGRNISYLWKKIGNLIKNVASHFQRGKEINKIIKSQFKRRKKFISLGWLKFQNIAQWKYLIIADNIFYPPTKWQKKIKNKWKSIKSLLSAF